jgi:hypothetical protein
MADVAVDGTEIAMTWRCERRHPARRAMQARPMAGVVGQNWGHYERALVDGLLIATGVIEALAGISRAA